MISDASKGQLRRLLELREKRDELKKALEAAEQEFRDAEADAYEALEDIPGSLPVDLGEPWGKVRFSTRQTHYGRVYNPRDAEEYFEQRAMIDEVSSPKFVMARINELVRECVEQGAELPPGLDYYTRRGVTITRQKG